MPDVPRLLLVAAGDDRAALERLRGRLRGTPVAALAASAAAARGRTAALEALAAALGTSVATRALPLDRRSLNAWVGDASTPGARLLWLEPVEVARLVAEALGLEPVATAAVAPVAGALVALDWPAGDARASLVGFDLDWLPPASAHARYPGGPGKAPEARAGGGAPSRD